MISTPSIPKIRLYTEHNLHHGADCQLSEQQHHYLSKVMRVRLNEMLRLFNGRDGEWLAQISSIDKKNTRVKITQQHRQQSDEHGPILAFAPTKNDNSSLIIQKATELGVTAILPTITERTIVTKVNSDKWRLVAMDAAEQCERLSLPILYEPINIAQFIPWCRQHKITTAIVGDPYSSLNIQHLSKITPGKHLLLIGPEGGLSPNEILELNLEDFICCIKFGNRVLRSETAVFSMIAVYNAIAGDWKVYD